MPVSPPPAKAFQIKYKIDHRNRRLMLADYHHMVDYGFNMEQIASALKYKQTRVLVHQLENLERLGYTVRWPNFPVPSYDAERIRWWREKLAKSA